MHTSSTRLFAAWTDDHRRGIAAALLGAALLTGCEPSSPGFDTDVLVIGGGIAGLAAALEASDAGAQVTIVEMNSVGGGHAVMAGGLFMVGTPLQAAKGVNDSVDLAVADILTWGEDADETWVRRYVEDSRTEVHDWLTDLGVEFALLLPAPGETSVPRFHFTRGAAVNVVVPMMRAGLARPGLDWRFNSQATGLRALSDGGWEVAIRELRTGATGRLRARTVIVATGGFENDLERVLANWLPDTAEPERLLSGAGRFATGSGLDLGESAGADIKRLDHQTIFVTGLPDPRDASGRHGLLAMNPAAIYVDANGRRFMNEAVPRKTLETTVLALPGQSYWMVFDDQGRRRLQVRGAPWLTRDTLNAEILGNDEIVQRADDVASLAAAAGLPVDELSLTIEGYNAKVALGEADEFGRFGTGLDGARPPTVSTPPFYAVRLYPMTRKSMGGLVIDASAQVLDGAGQPLPGLLAAGEATGVAGINGSHGGSGTFLGPSIYTGRIAGRRAAALLTESRPDPAGGAARASSTDSMKSAAGSGAALLDAVALDSLLASSRPGYWHFEQAHALVRERDWQCTDCHSQQWATRTAVTMQEKRVQLESCTRCH